MIGDPVKWDMSVSQSFNIP